MHHVFNRRRPPSQVQEARTSTSRITGQDACLHVFNQDGIFKMLQLKVIGIACFLLFFFSAAVYAMVKMTEREHKKD